MNENCKSFQIFESGIYKIIQYIFKFKWNFQKDTTIAMQENAFKIYLQNGSHFVWTTIYYLCPVIVSETK